MSLYLVHEFDKSDGSWGIFPNHIWQFLVDELIDEGCYYGFSGLSDLSVIGRFGIFGGSAPATSRKATYWPYATAFDAVRAPSEILIFPVDNHAKSCLASISLSELSTVNEFIPSDEIIFFARGSFLFSGSGLDTHVRFHGLDPEILATILNQFPGCSFIEFPAGE